MILFIVLYVCSFGISLGFVFWIYFDVGYWFLFMSFDLVWGMVVLVYSLL